MAVVKFVPKDQREEPSEFVNEEGLYRFFIKKHEVDGYSAEGNEKNKYTFECQKITSKDGKPTLSEDVKQMNGFYTADEKQYWVFGALMDALKISYPVEPCDLVGRYFVAQVKSRMYNEKKYHDIDPRSYQYSKMNDALPPIPEAKEEVAPATYDTADGEVPF